MKEINWSSFEQKIHIKASLEDVFNAWTRSRTLETWFLEKASFSNKGGEIRHENENCCFGDQFKWKWNNWDFTESGKIIEVQRNKRIVFTFGEGGDVSIDIQPTKDQVLLTLKQYNIPSDTEENKMNYYVGCSNGWTFWLTNLKAWLEHGVTLHATNLNQEETVNLVNS